MFGENIAYTREARGPRPSRDLRMDASAAGEPQPPPQQQQQLLTVVDAAVIDRVLSLNPGVRRLNLSKNAIADVTPEVGRLGATLQSLDVSGNQLRTLGSAFGALPQLATLQAVGNAMCVRGEHAVDCG